VNIFTYMQKKIENITFEILIDTKPQTESSFQNQSPRECRATIVMSSRSSMPHASLAARCARMQARPSQSSAVTGPGTPKARPSAPRCWRKIAAIVERLDTPSSIATSWRRTMPQGKRRASLSSPIPCPSPRQAMPPRPVDLLS